MFHFHKPRLKFLFTFVALVVVGLFLATPSVAQAATIYVDKNIPSNCSGNYSIANRNCSGSDGNAYKTISQGIAALSNNSTMFIRTGTYVDTASIGGSLNGLTISAYQNEVVTWQNTQDSTTLTVSGSANNITVKNINFKGVRYFNFNSLDWENYSGNVWKTVTPVNETPEIQSGCDPVTFKCVKRVQSFAGNECEPIAGQQETCKTKQTLQALMTGADGDYFQPWNSNDPIYFYSSKGNPESRSDIWRTGGGVTIVGNNLVNNRIIVEGCTFDGVGHVHLKGNAAWWVKNSTFKNTGTDWNDHHIYAAGTHSLGNEVIVENNYFENKSPMGAAAQFYSDGASTPEQAPSYIIFRNNVIKGNGAFGVVLDASNSIVANNSMFLDGGDRGIAMQRTYTANNVVENNIIVNPSYAAIVYEGNPKDNIIRNNLFYGGTPSGGSGICDNCTFSNNITGKAPKWINDSPATWSDFRLRADSPAIGAGYNAGTGFQNALSPDSLTWPPVTVNQNSHGSWEIGAFAYTGGVNITAAPTATVNPVCRIDINADGIVDLLDYSIVLSNFFLSPPVNLKADLSGDSYVDLTDYSIFANEAKLYWFDTCP